MRVQLGQLYDLRYSLSVDQLCVGEVLMPLERLAPAHLKIAYLSLFIFHGCISRAQPFSSLDHDRC
ncbi:hypothetical protein [Photorhabdus bodei]|uniref:hypothetical protein n=1 Tax=Photorhabdus bodei TaxID=2029681 RepID=UPI001E51659B|nr:hypothetical protein [Photorhabdus bodei]MCC8465369.1 hypothetical protein [Photorhabdus bodei]